METTNAVCPPVEWNVVQASQSFSALAGLIAGFVLTGLIVLLVERRRKYSGLLVPALLMFFAAFVGLGLNSYVFALVSGEAADACRRVWTAAAMSSGPLAAGVVAAVGGVVLLVHAYLDSLVAPEEDSQRTPAEEQIKLLGKLLRAGFGLIVIMVTLLVLVRHLEALRIWQREPAVPNVAAVVVGTIVVVVGGVAFFWFKPAKSSAGKTTDPCMWLYWGAAVAITHSVIGTIILGSFLSLTSGKWGSAPEWWGWITVIAAAIPLTAIVFFSVGMLRLLKSWRFTWSPDPETHRHE